MYVFYELGGVYGCSLCSHSANSEQNKLKGDLVPCMCFLMIVGSHYRYLHIYLYIVYKQGKCANNNV